jgi:hypothetical protein
MSTRTRCWMHDKGRRRAHGRTRPEASGCDPSEDLGTGARDDRIMVCIPRFPCVSLLSSPLLSWHAAPPLLLSFPWLYAAQSDTLASAKSSELVGQLDTWIGYTCLRDRSMIYHHGAWSGRCCTEQCSCQSSLTPTP